MIPAVTALLPVFLLILIGFEIRRRAWLDPAFWPAAEKLTYYLFFPVLLFTSAAEADLGRLPVAPLAAAVAGGIVAVTLICRLLRPLLRLDGPSFTSLVQGAIRPNTYVGISAALALYGEAGLTVAALCIAVAVPLVNLIAVSVHLRHAGEREGGLLESLGAIARNPLILACAAGILANGAGFSLPEAGSALLHILGRAALPVGLLAVGAGLDLKAARHAGSAVAAANGLKLLLSPLLTALLCLALGVGGAAAQVVVIYAALPTSASSYVLARQMGGNAPLMAGIITVTTLAAMAALPMVHALATAFF